MATLHPCLRAAGDQIGPCWIIFKGQGNINQEEKDFLNSLKNIKWAFQRKAWADGIYSLRWAKDFCDMLDRECPGDHMLLLDELSCQMSPFIKTYFMGRGVLPIYIPGGCTDLLQPVDYHFGALLKDIMNGFYKVCALCFSLFFFLFLSCSFFFSLSLSLLFLSNYPVPSSLAQVELELQFPLWREYRHNDSLGERKRRMMLASWLDMSWGLMKTQEAFIRKTFNATVLVTKDGAHKYRMKKLSVPYDPDLENVGGGVEVE